MQESRMCIRISLDRLWGRGGGRSSEGRKRKIRIMSKSEEEESSEEQYFRYLVPPKKPGMYVDKLIIVGTYVELTVLFLRSVLEVYG